MRATIAALPPAVLTATGLVAILTVAALSSKLLAVSLRYDVYTDTSGIARALGSISFLSIIAIALAIALARRGMQAIEAAERTTRQVTAVVLGVAYLHLILWIARVAAAALATSEAQSAALLMPNVFWWG